MPAKNTAPVEPLPAQPTVLELVSDTVDADRPLTPGTYVNTGAVDLTILQPAAVVKPGRVIELEFGTRHRDLRPATAPEITAAREAEAAEQHAAAEAAETGQEQ